MATENMKHLPEHGPLDEKNGREIMLSLKNFYVDMPGEKVRGVDLDVRRGEILGIAGIAGSGQKELLEAIAGLRPISDGSIIYTPNEIGIRTFP